MTSILNPATSKRIRSLRSKSGRSGSALRSDQDDSIPLDLTRDPNDTLKEILQNICGQQSVSTPRKLGHLNNFVKLLCNLSDDSLITVPMTVIMTCKAFTRKKIFKTCPKQFLFSDYTRIAIEIQAALCLAQSDCKTARALLPAIISMLFSLKGALVSDVKEVRAAAVRVLRYLINDDATKKIFTSLNLDFLVTRCLDISHFNEVERIQAVRLVRKIAHLKRKRKGDDADPIVPLPLMACIVSISLDGSAERDRVYRTCLAVLCELALLQPWLVVRCNGVLALVNAILECHMYQRINESLCLSLMHIINQPGLRKWHLPVLDVSPAFAPYTELNYRLHPDVDDSKLHEELEMRFMASKMAIVSLLRTWTGLLHVCHSKNMIKSLVDSLSIPNDAVRRGILSLIAELFYFNELLWDDDFQKVLNAAAPGHFRDNWRISEGFIVAEGKSLLPLRHVSRPDLVDCHLAIVLSSFLKAGLLEALTKVAISADCCSSVCSTVVLGLILHLANRILPSDNELSSWQNHLPQLFKHNTPNTSIEENLRINLTVKRLQEIHFMKNSSPAPYSVYLSQLMLKKANLSSPMSTLSSISRLRSITVNDAESSSSGTFAVLKRNRSLNIIRDLTDDHSSTALKNTKVLASKEHKDWDWDALQYLFLSPQCTSFLRGVGLDDMLRRFYRRLIYFYHPSSRLFSSLDLAKDDGPDSNRIYVETAIEMIKCLLYADDEGRRLLKNLITDIVESLPKVNSEATGYNKSTGSLAVTCSREYFLIISALSCHSKGDSILKSCKVYRYFMGLASKDTHETLVRLLVSSLHYSEHGPARMVLNKVLTTCSEPARLYATSFLRILLRANYPGFLCWGTEMLTTQLFDSSNEVALEALDILHEACDDRDYLRAVVRLRPTLLHLGDRGAMLVCRFMSVPQGFAYLSQNNYLDRELQRWWSEYNERYVLHVEELLKLSLTSFERPNKEDGFVRRSGIKKTRQSVYVPAHLYGELCRHSAGAELIEKEKIAPRITDDLRKLVAEDDKKKKSLQKEKVDKECPTSRLLKIKSYLWALAHVGSTIHGLSLIEKSGALSFISSLAKSSHLSSIRGTCLYCLSIVAQTIPGVEALQKLGYQAVLRTVTCSDSSDDSSRHMILPQPIVTPKAVRADLSTKSVSSQWSNTSYSSIPHRKSPGGSLSNISSSSDVTQLSSLSTSKSDKSSKISKLSKLRIRQHSRSSSESKAPLNSFSVPPVDHISNVFDMDPAPTPKQRSNSPSPHRTPTGDSGLSSIGYIQRRKQSLPVFSSTDKRSKTVSLGNFRSPSHQSKSKFKDRILDMVLRRNRSRSVNYSPVHPPLQNHDDASSGYASDQQYHLDSIKEHQRKNEQDEAVHLPTQIHVVQKSRICNSRPLASSITHSNETLKTELVEEHFGLEGSDACGTLKANFSWNTNNSGQTRINCPEDGIAAKVKWSSRENETSRTCAICCNISSSKSAIKRCSSFPNDIDNYNMYQVVAFRKSCSRNHGSTLLVRKRKFDVSRKKSRSISDLLNLYAAKNDLNSVAESLKLPPFQFASKNVFPPLEGAVVCSIKSNCVDIKCKARDRGNTQTSLDSGVITDSNMAASPFHRKTPSVTAPSRRPTSPNATASSCSPPLLLVKNQPNKSNDEWRFFGPKGLSLLRTLKDYERPMFSREKSSVESSILITDVLPLEERDHIIKNTHYVGIAVPTVLEDLFKPSVGQIPRSALVNPKTLLREAEEKDKQLEEAELMRERKASTARQAPKLRGLDESTFGPAVAVGLDNIKYGRLHSTIVTPCGRTPDSLLSETSDFCFIGGQLVEPGSDEHVALLHEEIIQLVINLASSVGVKGHETSLLLMKEKKPEVFDSINLYNSIVHIMSEHSFRLSSRRFIQELFQDVRFSEVHVEARLALLSFFERK